MARQLALGERSRSGLRTGVARCAPALLALLLGCAASFAQAGVYRWTDANGIVQYSDRKPESVEVETVRVQTRVPPAPMRTEVAPTAGGAESPAISVQREPVDVVMYLSPRCGWCRKAERFFDGRGVPWRGIDITASTQAKREFEQRGGRGTPLIYIDGERFSGFSQDRLERELASRGW